MPTPTGFSRTQIALHWGVALLIGFQLIYGEAIGSAFRSLMQGGAATYSTAVLAHLGVGVLILGFALWRLWLRRQHGVPPAPVGQPALLHRLAQVTHGLLYALLIAAPVTGLLAWFGASHLAAEIHELFKPALILLVALHVGGALYHQFVVKDGLIRRMMVAAE
jgi:cytochrome b561